MLTRTTLTIGITSCDRKPNYLERTLHSLFSATPGIEIPKPIVFIDGADDSFVPWYRKWPGPNRERTVNVQAAAAPFEDRELRIFWNTARVFRHMVEHAEANEALLLVQDDVVFTRDWFVKLRELVRHAMKKAGDSFALALWCGYPWQLGARPVGEPDRGIVDYPPHKYYGNVCTLFMPTIVRELGKLFMDESDLPPMPDDMFVKQFFVGRPWHALYAAIPSLVQHVGEVSTHGDHGHLSSPTFEP